MNMRTNIIDKITQENNKKKNVLNKNNNNTIKKNLC